MDLIFKKKTSDIEEVEGRLKQLTLAYIIIQDEAAETPSLKDGKKIYSGIEEMNKYIDKLDNEKEQWYYCDC